MKSIWQRIKKGSKNIYLCKKLRLLGRLTYPSIILPRISYKHLMDFPSLIDSQEIFVSRRSNKVCEDTFNKVGDVYTLREDAIEPLDVPNMSLNLMGGKFLEKYLKYIPNDKSGGDQNWDGVTKIYLCDFLDSYTVTNEYCPIYFDVREIVNQYFVYDKGKSPELTKEMQSFYKMIGKQYIGGKNNEEFIGNIMLAHVPTNLNYWHSEFRLQNYREQLIERKKQKWIERLAVDVIKQILCVNGYRVLPDILSPIPKEHYMKSNT